MKQGFLFILLIILLFFNQVQADWPQFQCSSDNHGRNNTVFIDRLDIDTVLKFDLGFPILAAPVVAESIIYAACINGKVQAINWKTGSILWITHIPKGVVSTPAVDNNKLYIGGRDGILYALDISSGNEIWHFAVEDTFAAEKEIQAPVKMTANRVYFGAFNGKLYCLDKDGNRIWDYPTRFYIKDAPAIMGNKVVISSRDEGLYCLQDNGSSCSFLWKNRVKEYGEYVPGSVGRCSPVIAGNYVFTNSAEAELGHFTRALSLSTGETVQDISDNSTFNTTGFAVTETNDVLSNIIIYGTNPLGRKTQKSGYYIRYDRSNAAPIVIGNYYIFHSSYHPRGIYFMEKSSTAFRDSLAMDGYTVSSSFAASDSVIFFGTYEGILLGMGNGVPIVGSDDPEKTVVNPVAIAPNPFNPATAIRFALAKSADVAIRVFNAQGRLAWKRKVRLEPGFHTIAWNGKDSRGRPLPSGLYVIQTLIAKATFTQKVTLMK